MTGHVFYARTHNHSSMGVATGSQIVSTHFDVPVGLDRGANDLTVVTNGIASNRCIVNAPTTRTSGTQMVIPGAQSSASAAFSRNHRSG